MTPEDRLLTSRQVAKMLNISPASFYRNVRPHLPAVQIGRLTRYDIRDVEAYIAQHKTVDDRLSTR